ncbi:MAG: hypothetical protein QM296_02585 [Bacillota bacterium]|nr:hypothetical protein [Bacillota bacterium]
MDKNCAGAPESGTNPDFWPRLAQKGRLCPEIGAGTKKLSKGGQKLRWCPEIGAGAEKLVQGWTASCIVGIGRSTQESVNRANVNRVKKKDDTSC